MVELAPTNSDDVELKEMKLSRWFSCSSDDGRALEGRMTVGEVDISSGCTN